jgi:hypothetical protein
LPTANGNDKTVLPTAKPAAAPQKPAPAPAKPAPAPAKPAAKPAPVASKGKKAEPASAPMAPPPSNSVDDDAENMTIAMQTRMASAEELEYLRDSYEKKQIRNIGVKIATGLAVIAILIGCYFAFLYRPQEKFTSWPVDKTGEPLTAAVQFKGFPWDKDLDLKYPAVSGATVEAGEGQLTVMSRLGKYQDIPLRLMVEYWQDKRGLDQSREKIFDDWITQKAKDSENWNFDLIQPVEFYQTDHGIPYLTVPYSRTVNNESFVGYAVFLRFHDWNIVQMKEIPTRDSWRAEYVIHDTCFLRFSPYFLTNHWEGMPQIQPGSVASLVGEAKALLQRHTPAVWQKADYLLRSALCKSLMDNGDAENGGKAEELFRQLRASQIEYFNNQKIAYLRAQIENDKKEMSRIRENLKGVFSSEEDLRFHKVRQNKWN